MDLKGTVDHPVLISTNVKMVLILVAKIKIASIESGSIHVVVRSDSKVNQKLVFGQVKLNLRVDSGYRMRRYR